MSAFVGAAGAAGAVFTAGFVDFAATGLGAAGRAAEVFFDTATALVEAFVTGVFFEGIEALVGVGVLTAAEALEGAAVLAEATALTGAAFLTSAALVGAAFLTGAALVGAAVLADVAALMGAVALLAAVFLLNTTEVGLAAGTVFLAAAPLVATEVDALVA